MPALSIILLPLGLALALFGYFIYFRKKYSLINGFDEAYRAGRRDERYARRVGMTEFVIGLALMIAGGALIIFA